MEATAEAAAKVTGMTENATGFVIVDLGFSAADKVFKGAVGRLVKIVLLR